MKLLFDQNISFRIVDQIILDFPNSQQTLKLGLENKSDREIWEYAKLNNFTIVTFDGDFCDIANLNGHPPKIIWLRIGNTSTNNLSKTLVKRIELIKEFITNESENDWACLEIK